MLIKSWGAKAARQSVSEERRRLTKVGKRGVHEDDVMYLAPISAPVPPSHRTPDRRWYSCVPADACCEVIPACPSGVGTKEGRKDLGACSAPTTSNGEILTQTQTVVVHQSLRERRTIERRVDRAQARVRHAEDRSIVRKLGLKLVREFRRSSEEKLQVITSRT